MNTPAPHMTRYDLFILACTVSEVAHNAVSTPQDINSVCDEFRRCMPQAAGYSNERVIMVCDNIIA